MSSSLGTPGFGNTASQPYSSGSYGERLQLAPDDERWAMKPPYGWFRLVVKFSGFCWYCGERVREGTSALYSKKLRLLAHLGCQANGD